MKSIRRGTEARRDTLEKTARIDCATMLRNCRLKAKLTQAQVAKAMKTKQSVIARLESGENNTELKMIIAFVDACGCHVDVETVPRTIRFVVRQGRRGVL